MRDAPPRTQGYFLLLVQEKVAKENDTPDGATQPCAPQALGPALILRGILPSLARHFSPGTPRPRRPWRGARRRGHTLSVSANTPPRPFGALSQSPAVLGFAPY